jgi:hypothetical protein
MRPPIIHTLVIASAFAGLLTAAAPGHAQPTDASALSGRWNGTYECNQGTTALELTLRGNAHGAVRGTFAFSATAENPEVPAGRYPVLGRLTGTSLVLRPVDAREMPADYVPVGIQAAVAPEDGQFTGLIEGPGCGVVTVRRTGTAAPTDPLDGYGQQAWTIAGQSPEGNLYVDGRGSPETGGGSVRLWTRWELAVSDPPPGLQAGQAVEWEMELDCDAVLFRTWHTLVYAADGELQSIDASAPYAWAPVPEDASVPRFAYESACSGAPAAQ